MHSTVPTYPAHHRLLDPEGYISAREALLRLRIHLATSSSQSPASLPKPNLFCRLRLGPAQTETVSFSQGTVETPQPP